jgi:hypothetical protein
MYNLADVVSRLPYVRIHSNHATIACLKTAETLITLGVVAWRVTGPRLRIRADNSRCGLHRNLCVKKYAREPGGPT